MPRLATFGNSFSKLRTVGMDEPRSLSIYKCDSFTELGTAFTALASAGTVGITNNAVLQAVGDTAFRNLTSLSQIRFSGNGNEAPNSGSTAVSRAFCASFGPVLCPLACWYNNGARRPDSDMFCCPPIAGSRAC